MLVRWFKNTLTQRSHGPGVTRIWARSMAGPLARIDALASNQCMLTRTASALLCCLASISAQARPGSFIATATVPNNSTLKGGLYIVDPTAGTITSLNATGPLARSYSIGSDAYDDTLSWIGTVQASNTVGPSIYAVRAVAGSIFSTTELKAGLTVADQRVWQVQSIGDEVLFLTSIQLSMVSKNGGTPRVLRKFDSTTGMATDFACDGRNLYVHMQPTRAILADHVSWSHLEDPANTLLIYTSPSLTYLVSSLILGLNSHPLLVESEAFSGVTNLKQLDVQGKVVSTVKLPFTYGGAGARMDHANSTILVAGRRYDTTNRRVVTEFVAVRNGKIVKTGFGTSAERFQKIDVRRHSPLHRFGHACVSRRSQQRLLINGSGLPTPGNAGYALTLAGPSNQSALMLLGLHGGMARPIPLAFMGAGSCVLGVAALIQIGVRVPATGMITLKAPIPAGTQPINLDVQWLVTDPGANQAGFLSSQVGSIVAR